MAGPNFNETVNIRSVNNKDKVKLRAYQEDNTTFGLVQLFGKQDFVTMSLEGNGVLLIGSNYPSNSKLKNPKAVAGQINIRDKAGKNVFLLNGQNGNLSVGTDGSSGHIRVLDDNGIEVFYLNGKEAGLYIGSDGNEGYVTIRGSNGKDTISLDGSTGDIVLKDDSNVHSFGIHTRTSNSDDSAGIWIGSSKAVDGVGNKSGNITLRDNMGHDSVVLKGGNTRGGTLEFSDEFGNNTISVTAHRGGDDNATIRVGGGDRNGQIILRDENGNNTVTLDAKSGDIILENADCAEEFEVYGHSEISPGDVMVISNNGKLEVSAKSYDKRVAGVVSGGGNLRPGILLDKKKSDKARAPLAMFGKVYCKVDADKSPINVGDMLTTSTTPGHAMKATNRSKAFGAIIGKALKSMRSGKGLMPILIALQ